MELSTLQYLIFLQTNQVLGPGFRQLRLEEICYSQSALVIASHLNLFGGPALFKDGLNFRERPLKKIGFCKQCFDKLCALLRQMPFTVNYQIKRYQDSTLQYSCFRSNPIFMVRLQVANVRGNLQPLSWQRNCLEF